MRVHLDNESLISLVEKHQLLWNPFLKNYRNKSVRYATWQRISAILGVDTETIQKRWRALRDRYKKELNGTFVKKDNKPWEYASMMTFLDRTYPENPKFGKISPWQSPPVIQPFTSQPVIITVPRNKTTPRPIAPKKSEDESPTSDPTQSSVSMAVDANTNFNTGNESEEQVPTEPEIYLVTPTLFNDQERTLFKRSLHTPTKRKASPSSGTEDAMTDGTWAKKMAIEEDTKLRRQECKSRLKWEEKEHLLRVECQEEEHKIKMEIEKVRLKVEEENLKIKEQKLKVLIAKEAYFKRLLEVKRNEKEDE